MRIRLLFLARYRELAGAESAELELPPGATARAAVAVLRSRGGGLAALPPTPAVALNRVHARLDVVLSEGDELAFLPPVAGG
jgi:MoaE-MoaD fusion protein